MSKVQRRSTRNGGNATRTQPTILKSRKRKVSENESDPDLTKLKCHKDSKEMSNTSLTTRPLDDVTGTSLNVEPERAITPEVITEDFHRLRGLTCFPTPQSKRKVPLPYLDWADRDQVWNLMLKKDKQYKKNPNYLADHPALQPRMRSILLDWLTEVCEVYKLHRETYYLSTEYIDRYLSSSKNVPKQQLQLIGITCLFIAAKVEEIYPPKLSEFSYVTDGACTDYEILEKELVILKTLRWDLSPVTCISWLNTFLQILHEVVEKDVSECNSNGESIADHDFIYPAYTGLPFVQVARILDLCTLEVSSLTFSQSILAATALSFLTTPTLACRVSGYSLNELQECLTWMRPFILAIHEMPAVTLKMFNQVPPDDSHNIQTHAVDLDALESVSVYRVELNSTRCSPPSIQIVPEVLTPPRTDEKRASHLTS